MSPWETGMGRLMGALRGAGPVDALGSAAVAAGIALAVVAALMDGDSGAGIGALGGVLFLAGLAALAVWEPRRRTALAAMVRPAVGRYMAATARWRWTDRMGVAGVLVGLAMLVPAIILQVIFGTVIGAVVIAPGIAVFWVGVGLVVYGRLRRPGGRGGPGPPPRGGWR